MSEAKKRLTVTVDPELVVAGNEAVGLGLAGSLSGWVNLALAERADKDRRLGALREAVADYEAEFGEISEEELAEQERVDRKRAIQVDGRSRQVNSKRPPKRPRRGAA